MEVSHAKRILFVTNNACNNHWINSHWSLVNLPPHGRWGRERGSDSHTHADPGPDAGSEEPAGKGGDNVESN